MNVFPCSQDFSFATPGFPGLTPSGLIEPTRKAAMQPYGHKFEQPFRGVGFTLHRDRNGGNSFIPSTDNALHLTGVTAKHSRRCRYMILQQPTPWRSLELAKGIDPLQGTAFTEHA